MAVSIQDRTDEFRSILAQAQRKQAQSKTGAQRQSLLTAQEKSQANGSPQRQRSEFARNAAEVARGVGSTMQKLERLSQLAKRKTLFDDRPVEFDELTFVIKQDMTALSGQVQKLQAMNSKQHPKAKPGADQEGEHNNNVVLLLKDKLQNVGTNFKDVLEVRTKNMQASRSRTEQFLSTAASQSHSSLDPGRTDSPLYQTPSRSRSPGGFRNTNAAQQDLLSLEPSGSSALTRGGMQSDAQLLLMEEAQPQNTYIQERGRAIESIESTIQELGGIFSQLAQMVSEQGEQIQRIDANTEDVVDNVEGAQRELMKYWSRVQGNRWLVAKMFGVLMICMYAQAPQMVAPLTQSSLSSLGPHLWLDQSPNKHVAFRIHPAFGRQGRIKTQDKPLEAASTFIFLASSTCIHTTLTQFSHFIPGCCTVRCFPSPILIDNVSDCTAYHVTVWRIGVEVETAKARKRIKVRPTDSSI
jgi:syntaxin 5